MHDKQAYEIVNAYPDIADRVFSLSSYAASKGLVFKDEQGRVASVSIPDPKGENYATYLHTTRALKAWLEILFPYIIKDLGGRPCLVDCNTLYFVLLCTNFSSKL